jgi:predicted O-linked N-acetylglucosamine transferase (SPINDLY family)
MCCFAPPFDAPEVTPLPAKRTGHLTFGSLHGFLKLNHRVFDLWSRVLHSVPEARLLMFHDTLVEPVRDQIRQSLAELGIDCTRLDLRDGTRGPGYLGVYGEIDVSLDAFPCTGGVTTCESLWMGVPMLTLCGVRPAGRNSAALLTRVGLTDWIAQTPEQFVGLAIRHSSNIEQLQTLRAGLRERMRTTLCDGPRFTRELEDAYHTMWQRCCSQH